MANKEFTFTDPFEQLDDDINLEKYKSAGKVVSTVLDNVINKMVPGVDIFHICEAADKEIVSELSKMFKNIKYKGIVFPTCISLNNIAGHYRPLTSGECVVKNGDIAKIELGAHIDGFPAPICYTMVVNGDNSEKINGKKAMAVRGVIEASREVFQLMRPEKTNTDIIKCLEKIAEKYNLSLPISSDPGIAPGVMTYQVSQYVLDGHNDDDDEYVHAMILNRDNNELDFTMRETPIEENDVYAVDIMMTTGNGRLNRVNDTRIFKRNLNSFHNLKIKSSKSTLAEFKREPFPQNMSTKLNPRFKFGLKECLDNYLLTEYPVMAEKETEVIARIKFTVVCREKNPILITGRAADMELAKLEH